jgi:hypothetical protein
MTRPAGRRGISLGFEMTEPHGDTWSADHTRFIYWEDN